MGFNYLFIFPSCYVALCACKAHHRLGSESVSWCLETSLFLRLPSQDGAPTLPLLSLFFSSIFFSYLLLKTMGCFSGCLMSSGSIHKLYCGIYSTFKCSFDEFGGERVLPVLLLSNLGSSLVEFGESTRDCSPGHAGKEGRKKYKRQKKRQKR